MNTIFSPIDLSLINVKNVKKSKNNKSVITLGQIIQDEYLTFNGIGRPIEIAFIRESGAVAYSNIESNTSPNGHVSGNLKTVDSSQLRGPKSEPMSIKDIGKESRDLILTQYFTDVYLLFLNKLTALVHANKITEEESSKLQSLLDEMVKVKGLLSKQ